MPRRNREALIATACLVLGGCSLLFTPADGGGGSDPDPSNRLHLWGSGHSSNTCLSRGNKLLCWGANYVGQLGIGHTKGIGDDERADEAAVATEFPSEIRDVSMSEHHTCAVLFDGELYCWGRAERGVLGFADGQNVTQMITEAGAIRLGASARHVAVADGTTCVETTDDAICFGANSSPVMSALFPDLTEDLGDDEFPKDIDPAPLAGSISGLAMGNDHACVVLDSDEIQCFGEGGNGELGDGAADGTFTTEAIANEHGLYDIALGRSFGCGIDRDDDVRCWGLGNSGQLGIASSESVAFLNDAQPLQFDGFVYKVVVGDEHACAMYGDPRKLLCWGEGGGGALGRGDTETLGDNELAVNKAPLVLEGVVDISAGRDSSCALLDTDEVVCWGGNEGISPDVTGILGWGVPCSDLRSDPGARCAYGDDVGESVVDAVRLKFDI